MHLRRSSERLSAPLERDAWDGLPARPAPEVVIKAPRAGDLVTDRKLTAA